MLNTSPRVSLWCFGNFSFISNVNCDSFWIDNVLDLSAGTFSSSSHKYSSYLDGSTNFFSKSVNHGITVVKRCIMSHTYCVILFPSINISRFLDNIDEILPFDLFHILDNLFISWSKIFISQVSQKILVEDCIFCGVSGSSRTWSLNRPNDFGVVHKNSFFIFIELKFLTIIMKLKTMRFIRLDQIWKSRAIMR